MKLPRTIQCGVALITLLFQVGVARADIAAPAVLFATFQSSDILVLPDGITHQMPFTVTNPYNWTDMGAAFKVSLYDVTGNIANPIFALSVMVSSGATAYPNPYSGGGTAYDIPTSGILSGYVQFTTPAIVGSVNTIELKIEQSRSVTPTGGITFFDDWRDPSYSYPTVTVSPVPEPCTTALLGMGALGLFVCGRRKKAE